jgi:hypothetical protein
MTNLLIQEYSDKTFVVRGDTKPYKDILKNMGGKWNSRLTEKDSEDKFGAWLFFTSKRSEVDEWFSKGCINDTSSVSNKISYSPKSNELERIEAKLDKILAILNNSNNELVEDLIDGDDDFKTVKKRLL